MGKLQQRSKTAIFSTIFWCLLAHGYRFANNMYTHDALLQIYQDDSAWQIALGRIFQPILLFVRGSLCNPWLICICALAWYCLTACILVDLLDIRSTLGIMTVAGMLVCNPAITATHASFLPWVDFYALALFLSCLGVWLCRKEKIAAVFVGILCLVAVLGIYQAYICVSICLVMILLMKDLQNNTALKPFAKKTVKYVCILFGAALLYFLLWKCFLAIFGIWTADTYNGMASVGDYSDTSIAELLLLVYRNVWNFFWNPDTFVTMMFKGISLSIVWKFVLRFANLVVFLKLFYDVIRLNLTEHTSWWQRVLQMLLLLLFPFGMNFVCFISKGMEHTLMIYAFIMVYVLSVTMAEKIHLQTDLQVPLQVVVWICMMSLVWSNVVCANQVYLKKALQEDAARSLMTRIVSDIEDVEGYIAGETPVAFVGSFENSPYMQHSLKGFKEVVPYGMGQTALTYVGTDYALLEFELNVQMNLVRVDAEQEEIRHMPTYPDKDSVGYIDGVLVVKISD